MHPQRETEREREIINTLFLSAEGTKTGFFRVLLTRTKQGEVGTVFVCVCMCVCVCVCVCVRWRSDWHIGMQNCRCVQPLPSLVA